MHTQKDIPQHIAQHILSLAVQTQVLLNNNIFAIATHAPVYEQNIVNTLHAITTSSIHNNTNDYKTDYTKTTHTLKDIAQYTHALYTHIRAHSATLRAAIADLLTLYIQILKASVDAFLLQDATLAAHITQHFSDPIEQTLQALTHAHEQSTHASTQDTHTTIAITQEILILIYSINNRNIHNTIQYNKHMDWRQEHPHYEKSSLEDDVPESPWKLWERWQHQAQKTTQHTNEIAVATSGKDGHPSIRMVLLKYSDERKGFCWYTNRNSTKGQQLSENPYCTLLWYNKTQQQQVRISGIVTEAERKDVETYARSRPRHSQISAFISKQSSEIVSREQLHQEYAIAESTYQNQDIPVSSDWTGYCLIPQQFEFWQGQPNRLHDRIRYTVLKTANNALAWNITRLYP